MHHEMAPGNVVSASSEQSAQPTADGLTDAGRHPSFSDEELKRLAVLEVFDGSIPLDLFVRMGDPAARWVSPELRGMTREAARRLLVKSTGLGWLDETQPDRFEFVPRRRHVFSKLFEQWIIAESVTAEASTGWRAAIAKRAYADAVNWHRGETAESDTV